MKKIYLLFAFLISQMCGFAQFVLPYSYNFDGASQLADGWTFVCGDPASFNAMFAGVTNQSSPAAVSSPNVWGFVAFMESSDYNQYLISPRIANPTADSVQFSFKYAGGMNDRFRIGYCTSDSYNSISDFSWQTAGMDANNGLVWEDFSVNVPANAQYVVINYCPLVISLAGVIVDDILIRPYVTEDEYTVTVMANEGGNVTPGANVSAGDDFILYVTPNEGYRLASVTLDGQPFPAALNAPFFSDTLRNVQANHTYEVTFAILEYSIAVAAGAHGTIQPDGGMLHQVVVPWSHDTTFHFTPDNGYHVADVLVDNATHLGSVSSYTFTNVRENHTIAASFAVNDYTITATAGVGGTITPAGSVSVEGHTDQSFTITPNDGYLIDSVYVDGESVTDFVTDGWSYTFVDVAENHTVSAIFALQHFQVAYTHSVGGDVTVSGGEIVDQNTRNVTLLDELTFDITPDEGYQLADIQLNGESVGAENPFVLSNVLQNYTVHFDFAPLTYRVTVVKHGNGTIAPMSVANVEYLDTAAFTLTPSFCCRIDSVLLDGVAISAASPCELTHLVGNHQLDVYFGYVYYPITILPTPHGTITGPESVLCDGTGSYELSPDPCYRVSHFLIDGVNHDECLHATAQGTVALLANCSEAHTISALFSPLEYDVNVTATGAGTISNLGNNHVACGSSLHFVIVPDECHYVSSLRVDNVDVTESVAHHACDADGFGDTLILDLEDIAANHFVSVTFAEYSYQIATAAVGEGTVTPHGVFALSCGDSQEIAIVPAACRQITSVYVDGEDVTAQLQYSGTSASYTFADVRGNHDLRAEFELMHYTMQIAGNENGSILPATDTVVECGSAFSFAVIPSLCYQVDTVWIDGVAVTDEMTHHRNSNRLIGDTLVYDFNEISENHNITVNFAPIAYPVQTAVIGNGQITGTQTSGYANCGDELHFTIAPDDCHTLTNIIYNGEDLRDYEPDAHGVVHFDIASLSGYVELTAVFEMLTYSVVPTMPENGDIVYDANPINCGESTRFTFIPYSCYHLDSVFVNGVWMQPYQLSHEDDLAYYEISEVRSNPSVSAHFSIDSVRFIAEGNAVLSVTDTMLACNAPLTCRVIQPDCQVLDSVRVNGAVMTEAEFSQVGNVSWQNDTVLFAFNPLIEDCTFEVFFSDLYYTLQVTSNNHGYVSHLGQSQVRCGDSVAISIVPDGCYRLANITRNGQTYPFDNDSLLIISAIREDCALHFEFEYLYYEVQLESDEYGFIIGGTEMLACGSTQRYKFVPFECGRLDSVWLDGQCVNSQLDTIDNSIHFDLDYIAENHLLRAQFAPRVYSVIVQNPEFVTMNVPAQSEVLCDSALRMRFTVDDCHYLSDLLVNGVSQFASTHVAGRDYDFEIPRVNEDCIIELVYGTPMYSVGRRVQSNLGVLEVSQTLVPCGTDTTLLGVWPDDCFTLTNVQINGRDTTALPEYDFTNLHQDAFIVISLVRNSYHIEVQQVAHCHILGAGTLDLDCGESVNYVFIPEEGYTLTGIVVDGDTLAPAANYEFLNVHANHTLEPIVSPIMFAIHTDIVGEGTIVPGDTLLPYGSLVNLQFVPEACGRLDSVFLNGSHMGAPASFVLYLMENLNVRAVFSPRTYMVQVQTDGPGTVSQPSMNEITCGDDFTVRFYPDSCQCVQSLLVNGIESVQRLQFVGNEALLTLTDVRGDSVVRAVFAPRQYQVTVLASEGGWIDLPNVLNVPCGENLLVNISPLNCYVIDSVFVNGRYVGNESQYVLANISGDSTIYAQFSLKSNVIAATQNVGGTVSPEGETRVPCGSNQTYTIVPDDGYYIDYLIVDGQQIPAQASYTFVDVGAGHDISAVFAQNSYPIMVASSPNGDIEPIGTSVVMFGDDFDVNIRPFDCYHVDSVFVDGIYSGNADHYHFSNVTAPHTLYATFALNELLVTTVTNDGGSIIQNETGPVLCGGTRLLTIVPDACYSIGLITVNGEEYNSTAPVVQLDNITENKVVKVEFVRDSYLVSAHAGEHGRIVLPDNGQVACGEDIGCQIRPDSCYRISTIVVNGVPLLQFDPAGMDYTFANVQGDSMLIVTFEPEFDTVSVTAAAHGTVTSMGENVLACGSDFAITITPDDCYRVGSVRVDGVNRNSWLQTVGNSKVLELNGVSENHNITVAFDQLEYNLSATTSVGGSINPTGAFPLCGSDMVFTIDVSDCYEIDSLFVNGEWIPDDQLVYSGNDATFTLEDIRQDCQLYVKFKGVNYQLDLTNNGAGVVNVLQEGDNCDGAWTISIAPADCESIQQVLLNGSDITNDLIWHPNANPLLADSAFYTIANVMSDQILVVNYEDRPAHQLSVLFTDGEMTMAQDDYVIACGSDTSLALSYPCYSLASVGVNGEAIAILDSVLSLSHILSDQTIVATFVQDSYTVTTNAGIGGTITGGGEVLCGDSQTLTITPGNCYSIASIEINGVAQTELNPIVTLNNVVDNQIVNVTFEQNTYTVTTNAGVGGTITGGGLALCGDSQTLTITPDDCYSIAAIEINDVAQTDLDSIIIISDITEDQTVNVLFAQNSYTITANAGMGGSITPNGENEVLCGANANFAITADNGYYIDYLMIDGVQRNAQAVYSFNNVQGDHTIEAHFAMYSYIVNCGAGENGQVAPQGDSMVYFNSDLTVTITPNDCYSVDSVFANGVYVGAVESYTFHNITTDQTLYATFVQNTYMVATTVGVGGTIAGGGQVICGDSLTLTIAPDDCYSIASIEINGVAQADLDPIITLNNVTENQTVNVTFEQNTYTVTANAGIGGTITGVGEVLCGDSLTLTIAPDDCYSIASIEINGVAQTDHDSVITLNNITENQTVNVTFEQNAYTVTANAGIGGTIAVGGEVLCGDSLTLTIAPDDCYSIASIEINGVAQTDLDSVITLNNITENQIVNVTFEQNTYTVTANAGIGGTITGGGEVLCGDSRTLTITPNEGYDIDYLIIDGVEDTAQSVYEFADVTANHTIEAYFVLRSLAVVATSGAHGQTVPSGVIPIDYGAGQHISIIPDNCYHIDSVFVNNQYAGNDTAYDFTYVTLPQTLMVTFAQNTYTVTANAGIGGTIAGGGEVLCGDSLTLTIAPDDCCSIASIEINGVAQTGLDSIITLNNITENQTVNVTFEQNTYIVTTNAGIGGMITGGGEVLCGDSRTLTIAPDDCYSIASIEINGVAQTDHDSVITLNNITENQTVNVTFEQNTYTVTANAGIGGTIAGGGEVLCGDSLTLTIVPDDCYSIASIEINGVAQTGLAPIITLNNITEDQTVNVTFEQNTYTVTANVGIGGTITGGGEVLCGDSLTLTIAPDDCYSIASIEINGVAQTGLAPIITLNNITEDQTVNFTFAPNTYTVTANAGIGGTITGGGEVLCGDSLTLTIAPDDCYSIASIEINGVAQTDLDSIITLNNITENQTVNVTFEQNTYTVTANAGIGGTIAGGGEVLCGDSAVLTIVPDDCYSIASIEINGVAQTDLAPIITLNNITEAQNVNVTFEQNAYTVTANVGIGGTITGGGEVLCGDSQILTIAPDDCYSIASIEINGVAQTDLDSIITLNNITENQTVNVTFEQNTYTVTANAGIGGTITGGGEVLCGDSAVLTIVPDDCYSIASIEINGVAQTGLDPIITLNNITEDQTVNVTFEQNAYTVTANAGIGGTVTGGGEVLCGDSLTLTIAPDDCYSIASIEINGVAQTDHDSVITLNNITENQTVNVTFEQNTYTVTANAGVGGTITGGGEVLCGDSLTLTIAPDDCYSIASIEINGVAQTDLDSIVTLNNVTENQIVNVTFAQNMYDVSLSVYLSENLVFTDAMQVACGTDTSIAIPSLDCAHIDMLEVNGEVVAVDTLCNLYDVSENYTIIAHLSMDEFSVVAAVQGNGSITPSDTSWVVCGNDQTYIFTPDAGWFVQELFIDGQSMGTPTSDSYTFYNVSDNHTIEVVFAVNEYIITSSVEPINAGQINPYGTHFYAYGDTVSYSILPFPNYRIADVLVDGVSVGAVSSYVFEFVDDNHTIVAYFEENIGIVEIMADENVTVYASSNTVYLRADANKTIRRVEIYDLRGRCVAQTNDCSNDMQMTLSVAPGTYVVRVLAENGLLTRKVMITRN